MTLVTRVPVIEMDGRRLYYTFIAGARKVIENQVELNKINVFPVTDGSEPRKVILVALVTI